MNTLDTTEDALLADDSFASALFADYESEPRCTVCRGRGCGACAWLGTAEAEEVYWETKRQLVRLINR